mmetsp:Transcript_32944/g.56307  ORF Transcript_32944/g.56307 Transcript_32944/m.56307 type:complete len:251 (-) Transcript_32944:189-941(-)
MARGEDPVYLGVRSGFLQVRLQPGEVSPGGRELARRKDSGVSLFVFGRAVEIGLGIDGHEVHTAVVKAVPHTSHAAALLRGHLPARIVGCEVGQRKAQLSRIHHAGRVMALRLMVAWQDVVRQRGGYVLHPFHVTVVGAFVLKLHQRLGRVEHCIVGIAHVSNMPHEVDFLVVLPALQGLAGESGRPIGRHCLAAEDAHWPRHAVHVTHVPKHCQSDVSGVVLVRHGAKDESITHGLTIADRVLVSRAAP